MKISIFTFGCTVNNYESQELTRRLEQAGDEVVEGAGADVIIVNSCVITGAAEKGAFQLIERQRGKNPDAAIILTGCYTEYARKNDRTSALPHGAVLLDKKHPDIVNEIHRIYRESRKPAAIASAPDAASEARDGEFRSPRALLGIQNGCSNGCAFCIVPHVRGGSTSTPWVDIEAQIRELSVRGVREFTLSGLNLGSYNHDGLGLTDILERVNAISEVERISLSSLEPMNMGGDFVERLPHITKLVPHLHISLQSGCDRTLTRMNRRYSFAEYEALLADIRAKLPRIAISTDIIVGFPGESEKDFEESILNIAKCQFSDIHIFKYSPRKGTRAAEMESQVTEHQKTRRALLLRGVKTQARYSYYSRFVGETEIVTLLRQSPDGGYEGTTAHGFPVLVREGTPQGGIVTVKITGMTDNQEALIGVL
jgi:threonylcarbamoyladenosine tRNA methylthiotransferase MtaB